MITNPPLTVEVIAVTRFRGVPLDLLPDGDDQPQERLVKQRLERMEAAGQDQGSEAARLIECAARNCYDSYGRGRNSHDHHQHILDVSHGSVLEHANITFYLTNVSRGLTHELVRHRAGVAISQRSTRYVDEAESPWIHHPLVLAYLKQNPGDENLQAVIKSAIEAGRSAYGATVTTLQLWLEQNGLDKLTARKQARGAARGYLGNALCTSMVWTANVRALRWVIEQRASDAADAEIRLLMNECFRLARLEVPEFFADFVEVPAKDGLGSAIQPKSRKA